MSWPVLGATFFCDVIAFALALGAMYTQSKVPPIYAESGYLICVYPRDTSTGLAAGSIVSLFVAQILISVYTRCFCFGKPDKEENYCKFIVLILFTSSWIMFLVAETFLNGGAIMNNIRSKVHVNRGDTTQHEDYCMQLKKLISTWGAMFTFFTMFSTFYIMF